MAEDLKKEIKHLQKKLIGLQGDLTRINQWLSEYKKLSEAEKSDRLAVFWKMQKSFRKKSAESNRLQKEINEKRKDLKIKRMEIFIGLVENIIRQDEFRRLWGIVDREIDKEGDDGKI